jgi:protein dithiol:quinone oxidoreductase
MISFVMHVWQRLSPRQWMLLLFAACATGIGAALVMQHVAGLEPCPMCIVQRYAMILVGLFALVAALVPQRMVFVVLGLLALLSAGFGAFVAARQSWLQWYPPEIVQCGRDFYGMIETFPLRRAIPMIFRGSGDCTKIDGTFLGLSIANWNFLVFVAMALFVLAVFVRRARMPV